MTKKTKREKIKVNFQIKLTEGQQQAYNLLHDKEVQYLVLCFSRQSGKSVFAEIALIEYLFKPRTFSAYISPTFALGRKVYKELIQLLEPTNIIKKANASTLTIETIFNSTLQFFSTESATAIRGNTVSGILVMDEVAYFPDQLTNGENVWANVILPITKARNPKVLVISTPAGKRGIFYDFYLKALNKEKGYKFLKRTIYDDSLVTEEQIEQIQRDIPEIAFKQEFLCEFLDSSLTFFKGFENCFKEIPRFQEDKVWIGVDLSGDGTDETILTKINNNNQILQYTIEGTLDAKYKRIATIINNTRNLQGAYIEVNGLGLPMYQEIRKLVKHKLKLHEWLTTNTTKKEIISNLAVTIANKDIHFNKDDEQLYSQFGSFICKITKQGTMTFSAMDGKKDDRIMSLAIALQAKNDIIPFTKQNIRIPNNGDIYIY